MSERGASPKTGGRPKNSLGREVLQSLVFLPCDPLNPCFSILYKKFFDKTPKLYRQTVTKMIDAAVNISCFAVRTTGKITCHISI